MLVNGIIPKAKESLAAREIGGGKHIEGSVRIGHS
jgi:hypothetical protein